MHPDSPFLNASQAAAQLGVSAKALRLYEQHGLLTPGRTAAGYRTYGPAAMARAAQIVRLRGMGLGLAGIARALAGDTGELDAVLAAHAQALDHDLQARARQLEALRQLRADVAQGRLADTDALTPLQAPHPRLAFELPWPWGGEWFDAGELRPLTYIMGSLGSGKTRLARRLADVLPDAAFLGLDRLADDGSAAKAALAADTALQGRVARACEWLADEGATASHALTTLLVAVECGTWSALVVDMVEDRLDPATQPALMAYLRMRVRQGGPRLFLMTRSTAILDLQTVGADEGILLCPANHSPPMHVVARPGAPGYEAVATCLASPAVRARIATMPAGAH